MRHTADTVPRGDSYDRAQRDVTAGCGRRTWRRDVERS
jgi:hypothetical protein